MFLEGHSKTPLLLLGSVREGSYWVNNYCSCEYGKILNQLGMKTSMSRKGNHSKKLEVKLW
jgi:hypothetical protein